MTGPLGDPCFSLSSLGGGSQSPRKVPHLPQPALPLGVGNRRRVGPPMGATHKSLVGGLGGAGLRSEAEETECRRKRLPWVGVAGVGVLPRACLALRECFRGEVRAGEL